jgi:hypothetical protein
VAVGDESGERGIGFRGTDGEFSVEVNTPSITFRLVVDDVDLGKATFILEQTNLKCCVDIF